MSDLNVNADLLVEEAGGSKRPLRPADWATAATGAASEAKLEQVRALVAALATEAAVAALEPLLEAIRDRLGSYGVGVPEEGTTNALLRQIHAAVDGLELSSESIALNADQINLSTDELEAINRAGFAALGTTSDPSTSNTSIGRLKRLVELAGALATRDERQPVADRFTAGEALPDQAGAGGVLTFAFTAPVDLVWVRSVGGASRADPFGGAPAATTGIPCADDEPAPITVTTGAVKVWAPVGATVSVWGYRYA